ncbi:MAG: hypothetical protein OEY49_15070 [Candidatus Heimdallarchaeota archaeon]|nr:hypothetical protein [Candidatus Heimdallarchaeota archaeon]
MATVNESNRTRIGKYKASKVGNGYKISIPREIEELWKLPKAGAVDDKEEKIELILYAESRGKDQPLLLVVSKEPLPGDLLG